MAVGSFCLRQEIAATGEKNNREVEAQCIWKNKG